MFKKIALIAILLGLFVAGNLIADEPLPTYNVEVEIHGSAEELKIGYLDVNNQYYHLGTYYDVTGTNPYSYFIAYTQEPPNKFCAEGWGPYGAHDYDECDAELYETNHLELWLGVVPDPEEPEPHQQ